jgi:hypothetical protein
LVAGQFDCGTRILRLIHGQDARATRAQCPQRAAGLGVALEIILSRRQLNHQYCLRRVGHRIAKRIVNNYYAFALRGPSVNQDRIKRQEKLSVKFQNGFKKLTLLAFALVISSFAFNYAQAHAYKATAVEYTYKVHNKSSSKITALYASEDGKEYGQFDIGSGIPAGATVTLVWDKSTDDGNCEQWIKAKFADGGMSPATKFDFCEKDLVLEFE